MKDSEVPQLSLLPFLVSDAVLLATAGVIVEFGPRPMTLGQSVLCVACVGFAAIIGILPFLRRYETAVKLEESSSLADTVQQIGHLGDVAARVDQATGYLQTINDQAEKTVAAASGVSEQMTTEAQQFRQFMAQAQDRERAHLKLEVEKLRRSEGDWVQSVTLILDHIHALHQASIRSGQAELSKQIGQFRGVCLDSCRRVGLAVYIPQLGEVFDPAKHTLGKAADQPAEGSTISDMLACGYLFQGALLRPSLVKVGEGSGGVVEDGAETGSVVEDVPAVDENLGGS